MIIICRDKNIYGNECMRCEMRIHGTGTIYLYIYTIFITISIYSNIDIASKFLEERIIKKI